MRTHGRTDARTAAQLDMVMTESPAPTSWAGDKNCILRHKFSYLLVSRFKYLRIFIFWISINHKFMITVFLLIK